jgi:hypothetical protein
MVVAKTMQNPLRFKGEGLKDKGKRLKEKG